MKLIKRFGSLCFLFGFISCASGPASGVGGGQEDLAYEAAVRVCFQDAKNIDKLKLQYIGTSYYNPYETRDEVMAIQRLMVSNKVDEAIVAIESQLIKHFFSMEFHQTAFSVYILKDNQEAGLRHRNLVLAMLEDLDKSGDGKTAETALHVLSVHDEYFFMRFRNIEYKGRRLEQVGESLFDVFEVVPGENFSGNHFYFNVDLPMGKLAQDSQGR